MSQSAMEICITASLCIGVFNSGLLLVALCMAGKAREIQKYGKGAQ